MANLLIFVCLALTLFFSNFLNSQASSQSYPLPINKGGTGANTAASAAGNLLGKDFANYSGVLPIAKGGTQTANGTIAVDNMEGNPGIFLDYNKAWNSTTFWVKVLDVQIDGTQENTKGSQMLEINGLRSILNSTEALADTKTYILTYKGGTGDTSFSNHIILKALSTNCSVTEEAGYWIVDGTDASNIRLKIYMRKTGWGIQTSLKWLQYFNFAKAGISNFTPEYIYTKPTNATNIYASCMNYQLKTSE
ncbi:MAG: hypothetical protein LBT91_02965 [Bifidobacteriaceae bacterium]|nr:hypothetical protein [Bifidobacteriaceae bacterium]